MNNKRKKISCFSPDFFGAVSGGITETDGEPGQGENRIEHSGGPLWVRDGSLDSILAKRRSGQRIQCRKF